MHRNHTDHIIGILDDHGAEAMALANQVGHPLHDFFFLTTNRQRVDLPFGQYHKLRQVNRIGAFTQNHPLRTPLAALAEKSRDILKVLDHRIGSKSLGWAELLPVTRKDIAHFALGNRDQ